MLLFGDSHTFGQMSGTPAGEPYHILVSKEKGYDEMNMGVSGTVVYPIGSYAGGTGRNLSDLYTIDDKYVPINIPYVIFQYGTNDGNSPQNATWVNNYKNYIQHFIDLGVPKSKIIICSPPYNTNVTYAANLANTTTAIAGIANAKGIVYCDFYNYLKDLGLDCNTTTDHIHGNGTIHRAMADKLKIFIKLKK